MPDSFVEKTRPLDDAPARDARGCLDTGAPPGQSLSDEEEFPASGGAFAGLSEAYERLRARCWEETVGLREAPRILEAGGLVWKGAPAGDTLGVLEGVGGDGAGGNESAQDGVGQGEAGC